MYIQKVSEKLALVIRVSKVCVFQLHVYVLIINVISDIKFIWYKIREFL
jgi:hypothetical protein